MENERGELVDRKDALLLSAGSGTWTIAMRLTDGLAAVM